MKIAFRHALPSLPKGRAKSGSVIKPAFEIGETVGADDDLHAVGRRGREVDAHPAVGVTHHFPYGGVADDEFATDLEETGGIELALDGADGGIENVVLSVAGEKQEIFAIGHEIGHVVRGDRFHFSPQGDQKTFLIRRHHRRERLSRGRKYNCIPDRAIGDSAIVDGSTMV